VTQMQHVNVTTSQTLAFSWYILLCHFSYCYSIVKSQCTQAHSKICMFKDQSKRPTLTKC